MLGLFGIVTLVIPESPGQSTLLHLSVSIIDKSSLALFTWQARQGQESSSKTSW